MRIHAIRSEGLAHLSYFISSDGEAMVIDPRRDCSIYLELAAKEQVEITTIFETHRNEDYIIGSTELQYHIPSARIGHSKATAFKYGDYNISDGETFSIGKMKVECLNTPGHTDDSMCYIVADSSVGTDPLLAFTGDTLFVNEVGRTDLVDIKKIAEMAQKLYASLHEKLLQVGDSVIVYPGHGAGSVCGGDIGEREITTIGYELANNPWLKMTEDEFVTGKVNQGLTLAPYFKVCERLNTEGPPIVAKIEPPKTIDPDSFERLMKEKDTDVVDTRRPWDFVKSHIPGSISLGIENMGMVAGWTLDHEMSYLLVLNHPSELERARAIMIRVGLDSIIGYLASGMNGWRHKGKPTAALREYSADELKTKMEKGDVRIADVRQPHERDHDTIKDSMSIPLTTILDDTKPFNTDVAIAAICPAGYRGVVGASLLQKAGFKNVGVSLDGIKGWKKKGYPTEN